MCAEHEGGIRALLAAPPCPGLPTGGFVSGCLDGVLRLYSVDPAARTVAFVRAMKGHPRGVISLAWERPAGTPGAPGNLLSGGWDGVARVWETATGRLVQTLEGMENGVCVLALPDGTVVTGSTGRKDEHNRVREGGGVDGWGRRA